MYLGYQNNKIILVADKKETLEQSPCIILDRIEETSEKYVLYQGEYVLAAVAAERQAEIDKQIQIRVLQEQLNKLDLQAIRALRAMSSGAGTQADKERLEELNKQAVQLRGQLQELTI